MVLITKHLYQNNTTKRGNFIFLTAPSSELMTWCVVCACNVIDYWWWRQWATRADRVEGSVLHRVLITRHAAVERSHSVLAIAEVKLGPRSRTLSVACRDIQMLRLIARGFGVIGWTAWSHEAQFTGIIILLVKWSVTCCKIAKTVVYSTSFHSLSWMFV